MKKVLSLVGLGVLLIGILSGCTGKRNDDTDGEDQTSQTESSKQESQTTTIEVTSAPAETTESTSTSAQEASVESNIIFLMDKLKDQTYVSSYGDEQEPSTWYIAAEELGVIGKPAIPYLIANLDTKDSYELGLTLYALLLATQDPNLQSITNGEYINVNLTFNATEQVDYVKIAQLWWDKYEADFK